nr:6943_t:CDS:2 [Entrophospora candida]
MNDQKNNIFASTCSTYTSDIGTSSGNASTTNTFINYLKESNGLTEFETLNYILASDLHPPPFKIVYRADTIESIRKLSIIFESNGKKTRVIIWPSGKINIMSATSYDDAFKIYNFLGEIFETEASNILEIVPTRDPPQPKTPAYFPDEIALALGLV